MKYDEYKEYHLDLNIITSLGNSEDKSNGIYESAMHHKFLITDDKLWTGSYNFSINASIGNWENALEIEDVNTVEKFKEEFSRMYSFARAIKEKLLSHKCTSCNKKVEDPFKHFIIKADFITNVERSTCWDNYMDQEMLIDFINTTKENGDEISEGEMKNMAKEKISNRIISFDAECIDGKQVGEISECCICNRLFSKSSLSLIKSYKDITETRYKFDPAGYPDFHEKSGQTVWILNSDNPIKEKYEISEDELEVCLTCFEKVLTNKMKTFK